MSQAGKLELKGTSCVSQREGVNNEDGIGRFEKVNKNVSNNHTILLKTLKVN